MRDVTGPVVDRLLVGAAGAINVANLHDYLLALRPLATRTAVVLTRSACALATPTAIRAYSGSVVYTDDECHGLGVPHMELALWADLVVVLPATANTLGKVAGGIADDLLTSIVLAHANPAILVPSMNPQMWRKPAVARNVATLREDGHRVLLSDARRPALETATGEWLLTDLMPAPEEVAEKIAIEAKAWVATDDGTA